MVLHWPYLGSQLVLPWFSMALHCSYLVLHRSYLGSPLVLPWFSTGPTFIIHWSLLGSLSYLYSPLLPPWFPTGPTLVLLSYLGSPLVLLKSCQQTGQYELHTVSGQLRHHSLKIVKILNKTFFENIQAVFLFDLGLSNYTQVHFPSSMYILSRTFAQSSVASLTYWFGSPKQSRRCGRTCTMYGSKRRP